MSSSVSHLIKRNFPLIFVGILFLISVFSFFQPFWGKLAVIFWYIAFGFLLFFCWVSLKSLWKKTWEKRSFFTIGFLLLFFVLILFRSFQPTSLSGETTQETACILHQLKSSSDWGFNQSCFLGYPARQYLIPAIPSLITGRSLMSLNLGGAIYFGIGLIIFAQGLNLFLGFNKKNDIIIAISLASLFHYYYFTHFLLIAFEQSIFPLSFGLIALGLLMSLSHQITPLKLSLIWFTLMLILNSYTPSLALALLVFFYLGMFAFLNRKNTLLKTTTFVIILTSIVTFGVSLTFRYDIKLLGTSNHNTIFLFEEIINLIKHLFFAPKSTPFFSNIFSGIFLLSLFSPFFIPKGKYLFPAVLWTLFTMVGATVAQGYSFYTQDFRIHRAMVVVPVIMFLLANVFHSSKINKKELIAILSILSLTGLFFSFQRLTQLKIHPHLEFIYSLDKKISQAEYKNMYFIGSASHDFISLNDMLQYFYPQLTAQTTQQLTACDHLQPGYYIFEQTDPCFQEALTNLQPMTATPFTDSQNKRLFLFLQNKEY